jgi:L-aminopeptidase/D-esterase-like protein
MDEAVLKRVGLTLGHYTDGDNLTGMSVFIADKGAYIGVDIRGSNAMTLNTPAFDPKSAAKLVHAVVLTGGSAFGLESAFGAMRYLEECGIGFQYKSNVIPAITGAVIYDLSVGNRAVRPTKQNGYDAAQSSKSFSNAQGNIGVGTGATVGKWALGKPMKGGFGIGVTSLANGILVVAFVVTNAIGDAVNPQTGIFYSECGQQGIVNQQIAQECSKINYGLISTNVTNTTLAVVATNVKLERAQLMKVAELAHNGMARAIHPIHTNLDGDVVFALSSLSGEQKPYPDMNELTCVDLIGVAAGDALVKGVNNSVLNAKSIPGFPAYDTTRKA